MGLVDGGKDILHLPKMRSEQVAFALANTEVGQLFDRSG